MIINSFRILAVVFLFIILLIRQIPYAKIFKNASIQLYLALLVMIILLLLDNVTGFILSLALLALYYRVYNDELKKKKSMQSKSEDNKNDKSDKNKEDNGKSKAGAGAGAGATCERCALDSENKSDKGYKEQNMPKVSITSTTQIPFITEEHLLAAQNNIIDAENYNKEIVGIEKGIFSEKVYGTQGLDNNSVHMRGYDVSMLGSLSYDIL